jgi:nuclear pore complex protein Nup62
MTCSTSYCLYDTLMDPWNVYICICMYVCICIYVCMYVYVCMHVILCMYVICTYVYVCIYVICMYVCVYMICMYVIIVAVSASRKQHAEALNLTVFINKFRIITIVIYCLIKR